ncbi:unnamed protein product [Closterium sp. Naga37s-1]|nr:unnamed protein product [Closterium sp. Naga37s-1]
MVAASEGRAMVPLQRAPSNTSLAHLPALPPACSHLLLSPAALTCCSHLLLSPAALTAALTCCSHLLLSPAALTAALTCCSHLLLSPAALTCCSHLLLSLLLSPAALTCCSCPRKIEALASATSLTIQLSPPPVFLSGDTAVPRGTQELPLQPLRLSVAGGQREEDQARGTAMRPRHVNRCRIFMGVRQDALRFDAGGAEGG